MNTKITFEDGSGKPITEQQQLNLKDYVKVISIDGDVKIKEEYYDNILLILEYYQDSSEITSDILSQFPNVFSIVVRERTKAGLYTIEKYSEYRSNALFSKGNEVLNAKNELIYSSTINPVDNQIDFYESNKYYYHSSGERYYTFYYGSNGVISGLESLNPQHLPYINEFKQTFTPSELPNLEGLNWENMSYYHNLEPMVPTS